MTTENRARIAVLGRIPGIVGMGAIGQALARRARAFDMEVVYHSRRPVAPELEAPSGARWVPLDETLAMVDRGEIPDAMSQLALERVARLRATG